MDVQVKRLSEAKAWFEGPELCREYFRTEKLLLGSSTLNPGETGDIDWGHKNAHEIFFVVKGTVSLRTPNDDSKYVLQEGDAIIMPETVPHELTNVGQTVAVVSWCQAPPEA